MFGFFLKQGKKYLWKLFFFNRLINHCEVSYINGLAHQVSWRCCLLLQKHLNVLQNDSKAFITNWKIRRDFSTDFIVFFISQHNSNYLSSFPCPQYMLRRQKGEILLFCLWSAVIAKYSFYLVYFCHADDWRLWIIFSVTLVLVGSLFKFGLSPVQQCPTFPFYIHWYLHVFRASLFWERMSSSSIYAFQFRINWNQLGNPISFFPLRLFFFTWGF